MYRFCQQHNVFLEVELIVPLCHTVLSSLSAHVIVECSLKKNLLLDPLNKRYGILVMLGSS